MEFEEQPIYQIITEIKGSDLPLEVKYGLQNHSIRFRSICADDNFRHCKKLLRLGGRTREKEGGIEMEQVAEVAFYDIALEYFLERGFLVDFMLQKVYGNQETIYCPSRKFIDALSENFRRLKADDILCQRTTFHDMICQYIFEDDGNYGSIDFIEWLKNRKETKD